MSRRSGKLVAKTDENCRVDLADCRKLDQHASMRFGFGLGLNSIAVQQRAAINAAGQPELILQAEIIQRGQKRPEGILVRAAALPWLEIKRELAKAPDFLFKFVQNPRAFEEFIAACYDKAGFDEVVLTPQRGDRGRDVIAIKNGFGSVRILEQVKAYSPGHLVSHDDVRAMLGALSLDPGASKGIVTTTSDFQPGIFKEESGLTQFMPHRLEMKNGTETLKWIDSLNPK